MYPSTIKVLLLGGLGLALVTMLPNCAEPTRGPKQTVSAIQLGTEVKHLPKGYQTVVIGGNRYYCNNETYYRQHNGKYVVVRDPRVVYTSRNR